MFTVYVLPVQMLFPSLMHILENIPHLVSTLLTSAAMDGSLGLLPAHTPQLPVEFLKLLEFAAKGKQLQVIRNYLLIRTICIIMCIPLFYGTLICFQNYILKYIYIL